MVDYTKLLNTLGEIKNELTGIRNLSETREERDVEVIFLTIPEAGGTRQFQIGKTSIDFKTGTIINPDGSKEYLNLTLDTFQYQFARSITVDSNQDILLRIIPFKLRDVKADHTTQIEYLTYNKIEITCTQLTNIKIWVSTHPKNVVSEFKGAANLTQTNIDGDLIEAQSYDTVYSLLNNLDRIRNKINEIKGTTNWYDTTPVDLTNLWDSSLSTVKIGNIYQNYEYYSNHNGILDNFTQNSTGGTGTATEDAANYAMQLSAGLPGLSSAWASWNTKKSWTLGTKPIICNVILKNINLGNSSWSNLVLAGLKNNFNEVGTGNFVGIRALRGDIGANFRAVTSLSGPPTETELIYLNGDLLTIIATSTSVKFYVNGTLIATHITNIPTLSLNFGANVNTTGGGTIPLSMDVEYLDLKVYK